MSHQMDLLRKAAELRRAFDQSFAVPVPEPSAPPLSFLLVRVGGGRYAFRTTELSGLEVDRKIVRVPADDVWLAGLAGVRGRLIPVYGLRTILGYEEVREPARWLVLCGRPEAVGLTVDEVEGQINVSPADLYAADGEGAREHVRETMVWSGEARRVLNVQSIRTAIEGRGGKGVVERET